MPKPLEVGAVAPDFSLPSSTEEIVNLYQLLQHSQVVLFFYPKAFTPVCTAEVCAFRDSLDQFTLLQAAVLGVSSDAPGTVTRFAHQNGIAFPLLSDEAGEIRRKFGVPKMFGILPGRVTYVIGQDRTIKQITVAGFKSDIHIAESLKHLQDTPD